MQDKIIIRTFGGFSISYKGNVVSEKDNRSKKIWTLLEYLVTFHTKEISTAALINLLWSEDSISIAPENALKTSLHRARSILDRLEYGDDKLIIHRRDNYKWNTSIPFEIDTMEFERLCKLASDPELSTEERLAYYRQAFDLYRGDYLPSASEEAWAIPIITYHHSLYVNMIHEVAGILIEAEDYESLIEYCYTASTIEPYDEDIHYYFIQSLYRSGRAKAAKEQYERVMNLFYDEFAINPSRKLTNLYREIIKENNLTQSDLNIIQEALKEDTSKRQSYYCEFAVFQYLYQLEARSTVRNGVSVYLCLFTIDVPERSSNKMLLVNAMQRMKEIISNFLRSGDVFSRYSINQYLLMLPSASYENSLRIGERIKKEFMAIKPKINVKISFSLRHIEPVGFDHVKSEE